MDIREAMSAHFGRMNRRPFSVPAEAAGGEPFEVHLAALTAAIQSRLEIVERDKGKTEADLAIEVCKLMIVDPVTGVRIFGDDRGSEDYLRTQVSPITLQAISRAALSQVPPDDLGN